MKLKLFLSTLAVLFVALIVYAITLQPMSEGFSVVGNNIWGVVTIADLYLGFIVFAVLIFFNESSKPKAAAWFIALCCIGNPVAIIYVLKLLSKYESLQIKS